MKPARADNLVLRYQHPDLFAGRRFGPFAYCRRGYRSGRMDQREGPERSENVLRRKLRRDWTKVDVALRTFRSTLDVTPLTLEIHDRGVALSRRYDFAIYDAMMVAAAIEAECDRLYTEDMHHGLVVDERLTIVNPFL